MEDIKINLKDQMLMCLMHYFVTKEHYVPVMVKGSKDEMWLENLENPIKIIRINNNYIHNDEQHKVDIFKLRNVIIQIKRKTFAFKMKTINICLDMASRVEIIGDKNITTVKCSDYEEILNNELLNEYFPNIKENLIIKSDTFDSIKYVADDINKTTNQKNELFDKVFKSKKIIVTYVLMAICILLFALSVFYPVLNYGALNKELVKNGQFYRLFTANFLHWDILHLFVNMYSLKILGKEIENNIGKIRLICIFIISGIFGSLFSILLNGSAVYSVGASGAIFGLAASLMYFGYYYRLYINSILINQLMPVIAANLMLGFIFTGIDNAAHIGGLVGGYLAASSLGIPNKTEKTEKINSIIAMFILFTFMIYMLIK